MEQTIFDKLKRLTKTELIGIIITQSAKIQDYALNAAERGVKVDLEYQIAFARKGKKNE